MLGLSLSLGQLRSGVSILALFTAGVVGVWYDPSDLPTIFQDSAGTTPVTAAGQTVGLMLDKSQGLVLGPQLIANSDFATVSDFIISGPGSYTVSGGVATVTRGASLTVIYQKLTLEIGKFYEIRGSIALGTSPTVTARSGIAGFTALDYLNQTGTSTFTQIILATSTSAFFSVFGGSNVGDTFTATALSYRLLPGNHAVQATAAKRPIYGFHPFGGVRNLFTFTEDFANAVWTAATVVKSGAQTLTYVGGLGVPVSRFVEGRPTIAGGTGSKSFTVSALVSGTGKVRLKNTHQGVADNFSSNITLTATPTLVTLTVTNSAAAGNGIQGCGFAAATDDVAFSLTVAALQMEEGATATAYQKVVTQDEVTEAGVPSVHRLRFDGIDDAMMSTLPATLGNGSRYIGVAALTESQGGIIAHMVHGGTFGVAGATFGLCSRVDSINNLGNHYWSAQYNSGLSGLGADVYSVNKDGSTETYGVAVTGQSVVNTRTTTTGAGNYCLFARVEGSAEYGRGDMYGTIIAEKALSATELLSINSYLAAKAGVVPLH